MDTVLIWVVGLSAVAIMIIWNFKKLRTRMDETMSWHEIGQILLGLLAIPTGWCMWTFKDWVWESAGRSPSPSYYLVIVPGAGMLGFMVSCAVYENKWTRRLYLIGEGILSAAFFLLIHFLLKRYLANTEWAIGKWDVINVWQVVWMFLTGAVMGLIIAPADRVWKRYSPRAEQSK